MSGLNCYYRRSHIAEKRFRFLVRYFAMDFSASQTALLNGISRRTTNAIFLKIRVRLFAACQAVSPFYSSEVEVDESYFGARRVRGKRGRGAFGKYIVFSIYKSNDFVFAEIVPDV
jgi:transposase